MTQVLIQTKGWNPDTGQDEDLGYIVISMMLPVTLTTGKWFEHTCFQPEALWATLKYLDTGGDQAKKDIFGWEPVTLYERQRSADDLLNELESL